MSKENYVDLDYLFQLGLTDEQISEQTNLAQDVVEGFRNDLEKQRDFDSGVY